MLFSFSLVLFFFCFCLFVFLLRSKVCASASLPAVPCSNACSYLCSNRPSTAKLCLHLSVSHVSQPQAILFSSLNSQPCLLTLLRLQWSQSRQPWTRKCAQVKTQRTRKVPLQLCESRKLKQHIWKPPFHPWPLLPRIFSMGSYLLNQAHCRRAWRMSLSIRVQKWRELWPVHSLADVF